MTNFERSIKVIFDNISGHILNSDEIFKDQKDGFLVRKQFHQNQIEPYCCLCDQKLNISTSKNDKLHFKHEPNSNFCILKDPSLPPSEIEKITQIFLAKESPRHWELKNLIGERLLSVKGIDPLSIAIDNKVIIRGNEKRRPDVFCQYDNKLIVFEIQLSKLSLKYILNRYEFYKKYGIYLIWILDKFDIHHQGQLERDIKYLTEYENFFKLDEKASDFRLECEYKFPFVRDNEVQCIWKTESVELKQLKFDHECWQVYFYDFGLNNAKREEERQKQDEQKRKEDKERLAQQALDDAEEKSWVIINKIKEFKRQHKQNYLQIWQQISELDEYELVVFNSLLKITDRPRDKKPALQKWMSSATMQDIQFIKFVLDCDYIILDVNQPDSNGVTALQTLCSNMHIMSSTIVTALFRRGYRLKEQDEISFKSTVGYYGDTEKDWAIYQIINNLSYRELVDEAFTHAQVLLIIESARRKVITGFRLKANDWIAFANNAIHHYAGYWDFIERAFRHYGLWEIVIGLDRKETFRNKLEALVQTKSHDLSGFEEVFRDLYPELVY